MPAPQFAFGGGRAWPRGQRADESKASRRRIQLDRDLDPQPDPGGARPPAYADSAARNRGRPRIKAIPKPLSPVEGSERMGEEERHHDDARPKDEDVLGFFQVEIADAAHEQIGDGEVEEPPEDIDPRRRQTYPGRGRKGALEGMSRDAVSEMGQRVGEEGSPEKVGKVVIPAHSALDCGADA